MRMTYKTVALLTLTLLCSLAAVANGVELPRVFGDGMVLQRDKPVNVWGWGTAGETVTVEFHGQQKSAEVGEDGRWLLTLDPMPANAHPQTLKVHDGNDAVELKNVVIGDVWLCSGQSNMESAAGGIVNSDLDMPRAHYPNIRCLTIPLRSSPEPLENFPVEERNPFYVELKGVWRVATPETARDFPAVGYHFARIVHEMTGVPIGLIDNSWGGSVVETWISRETLETIPAARMLLEDADAQVKAYDYEAMLARQMEGWKQQVEKAEAAGRQPPPEPEVSKTYPYRQGFPGGCFNGLIAPIQKFAIKGALFYQGINNCVGRGSRPNLYMKTFPALIADWRKAFDDPDLPFGIIQMTSFGYPTNPDELEVTLLHNASAIREAQSKAHRMHENTGLVCTYDLGHIQMHSPYKRPIGERAARWALADVYGVQGVQYNLAMLESWEKDGNRIVMNFTAGSYPSSRYGMRVAPTGFVIAGKDRHFYPAEVKAVKHGVYAASSPFVEDPVAVRYAWGVHPVADFGNGAGPAPPFRTDDWPWWVDGRYQLAETPDDPHADQVPTRNAAQQQAWERRAAEARTVLEEYETWKKEQKR